MRFLVGEQSYETAVSSGQYKYTDGAVESWRQTTEPNGFQIIRVDLDLRDTGGGSYLYHLVQDENGNNVRLTYRYFDANLSVRGNVIFEDDFITNSREVAGVRYEEQYPRANFILPTTFGLSEIGRLGDWEIGGLLLLNTNDKTQPEKFLALTPVEMTKTKHEETEKITVSGKEFAAHLFTVHWLDQERTVWLTDNNIPLKMHQNDGLVATATRHTTY